MIGDVEAAKTWRQYSSENNLEDLVAENGFNISTVDGTGLFDNVMTISPLASRM